MIVRFFYGDSFRVYRGDDDLVALISSDFFESLLPSVVEGRKRLEAIG